MDGQVVDSSESSSLDDPYLHVFSFFIYLLQKFDFYWPQSSFIVKTVSESQYTELCPTKMTISKFANVLTDVS